MSSRRVVVAGLCCAFGGCSEPEAARNYDPQTPALGVLIAPLEASDAPRADAKDPAPPVKNGMVIRGVMPGSPAHAVGLQRQDIIVAMDGVPVRSSSDFDRLMVRRPAHAERALHLKRLVQTPDGAEWTDQTITIRPVPIADLVAKGYIMVTPDGKWVGRDESPLAGPTEPDWP